MIFKRSDPQIIVTGQSPYARFLTPKRSIKGGFYHDGRFATLPDVVNHYDSVFKLRLTDQEKNDLIEYLKSI
jgi:hypothetical protein